MTEDITYDDLYARYENAKHLLKEIRSSFSGSFENVSSLIEQYGTSINTQFLTELSEILNKTKQSLESLFLLVNDPGLFQPTKLEQQIVNYQIERKQGIEMVQNLQTQIESLQEEKRNWTIREEKGKKLIEQYQIQLQEKQQEDETNKDTKRSKNGTYNTYSIDNDDNNDSNNYDNNNNNVIQELTDELELALKNAGDTRKMVDSLQNENKLLSNQVLVLREQTLSNNKNIINNIHTNTQTQNNTNTNQLKDKIQILLADKTRLENELATYKKRLSKNGGNVKQLYRNDTVTEWNEDDLAAMKEEMRKELLLQHQEALDAQFEKQFALRTQHIDVEVNEPSDNTNNNNTNNNNTNNNNTNNNNMKPPTYDRAFRDNTKTQWDQQELLELKKHMKEEMQVMATKQKQIAIAKMVERGDSIRNNYSPNNKENEINEQELMEQIKEMKLLEKQAKLSEMIKRNDTIRDEEEKNIETQLLYEQKEKDVEDMLHEMERIKQDKLRSMVEKNYNLVTASSEDVVNTKVIIENIDEEKEMEQQMIALKKQELLHKTDTLMTAEPQIKPLHENKFELLMKEIGILNPSNVNKIWNIIENIVNGDKRNEIINRAHSITKSMMDNDLDELLPNDNNNDNNNNNNNTNEFKHEQLKQLVNEKNNEIEILKNELTQLKQQQQELEDDDDSIDIGILETGIQTPGISDTNELNIKIENLHKENQKLNNTNQTITNKLEHMNDQIHHLKQEIKTIENSKINLIKNTSKEIDSLRQLLTEYVRLANQQKQKLLN